MTLDITNPAQRKLLAVAARHVVRNQAAFQRSTARQLGVAYDRAYEILETLAAVGVVRPPEPPSRSWEVLMRAERADEIYDQILEGPSDEH